MGWLPLSYKDIIKVATNMATPQQQLKTRRKLGKIFVDLNKLFTIKELSQKFKIPEWKIYRLKKFRKVKLPPRKTIEKVYRFYNQLQKRKRKEDLLHHYTIERKRIKPAKRLGIRQIKKLIEKYGIEGTAKKLKVSPLTIKRWEKGIPKRIKTEYREKIFELYREITKKLVGIFLIAVRFPQKRGRFSAPYRYITYEHYFNGTEEEFYFYISTKAYGEIMIEDSLIEEVKKFTFKEAKDFLKNLKKVDAPFFSRSFKACQEFIEENFTGKTKTRLLKELEKYA
jgi:transcriptional regulator with XRE-family HTH domain